MANVSLDETLFYQYMINNNSTSTMLNAISGTSNDDSSNMLTSVLSSLQSVNNWGTGSISDISTLLGFSGSSYSGIGSLDSFSSVLQSYLNENTTEAAQMAEKLEQVLEETAGTEEEGTKSYQTVQELYQYFSELTSGQAAGLTGALASAEETSGTSDYNTVATSQMSETTGTTFDFDSFEEETDEMIDSLTDEVGINV